MVVTIFYHCTSDNVVTFISSNLTLFSYLILVRYIHTCTLTTLHSNYRLLLYRKNYLFPMLVLPGSGLLEWSLYDLHQVFCTSVLFRLYIIGDNSILPKPT